jgi:hypothetical protein
VPEGPEQQDALFVNLVLVFQSAAMQQMGKIANPVTGKIERNLDQARFSIDTIEMLRNKTRGNLSSELEKLLDSTLTNLRMNYVEEAGKGDQEGESEKTEEAAGGDAPGEPVKTESAGGKKQEPAGNDAPDGPARTIAGDEGVGEGSSGSREGDAPGGGSSSNTGPASGSGDQTGGKDA